jgi:hypothetical protein
MAAARHLQGRRLLEKDVNPHFKQQISMIGGDSYSTRSQLYPSSTVAQALLQTLEDLLDTMLHALAKRLNNI